MAIRLLTIICLIITLCFITTQALARTHGLEVIEQTDSYLILRANVFSWNSDEVVIDSRSYASISLDNEAVSNDKGSPQLPYISASIQIPARARVSARILSTDAEEQQTNIMPSKGIMLRNEDPDSVEYSFGDAYSSDAPYPRQILELSEPFILREVRGITLKINPFVYKAQSRILQINRSLDIRVDFELNSDPGKQDPLLLNALSAESQIIAAEFRAIYQSMFINYSDDRYTQVNEKGKLLVIAPSVYMSGIQPYVDWKRQKGIPTEVVDMAMIGTTATQLKTYVQNYYNNNPTLVFVQLVGDAQHIPTASYTWNSSTGASDPTLSLVAGSDNYPDIFIGRFSCESATDLETQVLRSVRYERDMTVDNAWVQTAVGIASSEGGSGQGDNNESDETHMNVIRTGLLSYGYSTVDQFYESAGATAAQVTAVLNSGRGFLNYVGHGLTDRWGTTGFNNNNVNSLNNQNKLPFIVSIACLNGNFSNATCFGEAWLRARVANNPTGALAFYGSSVNQPWNPPMRAQDEISSLLRNHQKNSVGGLFYNGSCRMIEVYGTTNGGVATFRTWHIFGDVSLMVRTKTPTVMTPQFNQSVVLGSTSFTVNTGVSGALACLSYQNQIVGSAYANSSGIATLTISLPPALAQLTLTITAFNKVTYLGTVQVVPSNQAYLLVDSFVYMDGNNQVPQNGEAGGFDVIVKNIGSVPASNVSLGLTSSNSSVTITEGNESIASVPASGQVSIPAAFGFILPFVAVDQSHIPFSVAISATQGSWNTSHQLLINAPQFFLGGNTVLDPTGNNNHRLDPGETVTLEKTIQNTGSSVSPAGTITLSCADPRINISTATVSVPATSAGFSSTVQWTLSVGSEFEGGTNINLNYSLSAQGYEISGSDLLPVGLIIEDFETANFASFPWQFSGSLPWQITNTNVYNGSFTARSGAITHNQTTSMQITLNVLEAGNISFFRKVSSDLYYDKLNFYIDNTLQGSWHGEVNWSQQSYAVNTGLRTFRWEYTKDVGISTGLDCAWLDDIIFPKSTPVSNYNPPRSLTAVQSGYSVVLGWNAPISGIPTSFLVFRDNVQIHQCTASELTWTDSSVQIGATYIYKLKAAYSGGVSEFSNTALVSIVAPPQIGICLDGLKAVLSSESVKTIPVCITNTGGMQLNWTAEIVEQTLSRSMDRNIANSTLSCSPGQFTPGSVSTFTFSLKNMSNDGEYLYSLLIDFPDGFVIQSSTSFVDSSSGSLVTNGATGNGITVVWTSADPNGWGVITPGVTATAQVSVFVENYVSGNQNLAFTLNGENWGSEPHTLYGNISLENEGGLWVSLAPEGGTIAPNGSTNLQINVNGFIGPVGVYDYAVELICNDPEVQTLVLPLKIRIYSDLDWFRVEGLVADLVGGTLALEWSPLWECDAYVVQFSTDSVNFETIATIPAEQGLPAMYNLTPLGECGFHRVRALMEDQ